MTNLVAITTDFGDSFATAQLKAVLYGLGFAGQLIENHNVTPFSIVEGAYGIWQLAKYCPTGTIHVGVVDPGVGSNRASLVIQTSKSTFIGPDNGLLYPAANAETITAVWRIDEQYFGQVAPTFHGRDVFVRAAALLAQGLQPDAIGCKRLDRIEKLEFKDGQVVHIDNYGNTKYWGQETFGLPVVKTFSDVLPHQPLILNGSSDLLELAVNFGSAADKYGLKLGQIIERL